MKRPLHLLLLLSFSLLQCVAPLVHAHVDGHHGSHRPALETSSFQSDTPYCSQSRLEQQESAAITLPHELQRDDKLLPPPPCLLPASLAPPLLAIAPMRSAYPASPAPPAYHLPHPHAPPAAC